jgi:hypothetical protein
VMGNDVKIGVDFEDGLAGHEGFGVAFVLERGGVWRGL